MSDIDPKEFGQLQEQVSGLRRDTDRQTAMLERLGTRLENIESKLSEARGGWRLMMALGGAAASLGGLITWALTTFSGRGPP